MSKSPFEAENLFADTRQIPGCRIRGDQQHFLRRDELKRAWEIFTPILHKIDEEKKKPTLYKQGGRGPPGSDKLIEAYGFQRTSGQVTPGIAFHCLIFWFAA